MASNDKKPKKPLVRETQKLHEIELEAFEHLGKAVERLENRIDGLEAKFVSLEERIIKLESGEQQ